MKHLNEVVAYILVMSLFLGTFFGTGAFAAEPGNGGDEETGSPFGVFFWVGIGAVIGIATIAIWQGINDAKKKAAEEEERKAEEREIEDFDEYFRSLPAEEPGSPDKAETPGASVESGDE